MYSMSLKRFLGIDRWINYNYPLWIEIGVIIALTPLVTIQLILNSGGLLLPTAQSLIIIYFFIPEVYRGRLWRAAGLVLLWSLLMVISVAGLFAVAGCNHLLIQNIINGWHYSHEMFMWIETGKGPEGDVSLFLIPKIKEITIFTLASFLTAGIAGLFMGAVLLNYMNTYYGLLVWASNYSPVTILMGWPIYAIIRVIGYVFLGTVLARTMIYLLRYRGWRGLTDKQYKVMLITAIVLIILDFILKATIANAIYQPILKQQLDPARLGKCECVLGITCY